MMRAMRENTKIILWIVVIAFIVTIFAVWGLDLQTGNVATDPNVIGDVNGVPISRSQYQFIFEQYASQFRGSQNQELTYAQREFIGKQAWDQIIYGVLTNQQIEELGITVSDDEIVAYLRTSPPPEVRQYFLDDSGSFDINAYQAALNNPQNDWTNLEQLARERIPQAKLNEYLSAQVHVSEEEILRAYLAESTDLEIEYATFAIADADVGEYAPSEEEIEKYYRDHEADYTQPERARAEVVVIPLQPSAADIDDARFSARRVKEQLDDGEDFAELAKTYSEAPTSFVGGSTGFIRRGSRDDSYFDALDQANPGDVLGPIESDQAFYVIRLVETRTSEDEEPVNEYNVAEILVKARISAQTSDSLYNLASDVLAQAQEDGLQAAGEARGLSLTVTEPFEAGGIIGALGFVPALSRFAHANDAGTLSKTLRDDNNIYLASVTERIAETLRPLDDVREFVTQALLRKKKRDVTEIKAKALFRNARNTDFATAAQLYGVDVKTSGSFRAADGLGDFGPNSVVAEAALAIEPNEVSPPVECQGSMVVVHVLSRSEIDPEDYKQKIPAIRDNLMNQKVTQYVTYWFDQLKAESVINDLRS